MLKTAEKAFGERKVRTIRVSWLRLYATMAFLLIVLLVAVLPLATGHPFATIPIPLLFGGLMFELAFSFVYAVCFPTRLSAEGVRAFNFWGLPCRMTWDEISAATPSRFLGLPWLIVRSHRTKNALWLPLFYADKPAFWEMLAEFAPPSCPLLAFRTGGSFRV